MIHFFLGLSIGLLTGIIATFITLMIISAVMSKK